MLQHSFSHARLMRESTDCVEAALDSSNSEEQWVARRILDNPTIWSQWELEHSGLMRQLAGYGFRPAQVAALKHATFRLLHGKALFHHLRDSGRKGEDRIRILAHFRPGRSYPNAMISEHNIYLRKACSYLCAQHLGSDVIEDPAFLDPVQRYEELYAEYFSVYCSLLVPPRDGDPVTQAALLPLLKQQLNEYRWAILDPRRAQPFLRAEAALRRPTGDTQRLPALKARNKIRN